MPHSVFKAIKQALTPSAFEPELPSNYLDKYATARKLSYASSNSTFSLPEFDPLEVSAYELSEMLNAGAITSVEIVEAYLQQIDQHNRRGRQLRALISVAPRHELMRIAKRLDDERLRGKRRGPLHGIPVVLKDNIMTDANLGMDTTVGTSILLYILIFSKKLTLARFICFRWLHTEKERNNRRPSNSKRSHHSRKSKPHGILRAQESFDAARMVGCRRTVPVTLRCETHRKEEVALGAFSAWRLVNRICSERSCWFQRASYRN